MKIIVKNVPDMGKDEGLEAVRVEIEEGDVIIEEAYAGVVFKTVRGDYGVCARDDGIEVTHQGELVFTPEPSVTSGGAEDGEGDQTQTIIDDAEGMLARMNRAANDGLVDGGMAVQIAFHVGRLFDELDRLREKRKPVCTLGSSRGTTWRTS